MASVGDIKINMQVNGYTCGFCGEWVSNGVRHACPNMCVPPIQTTSGSIGQCGRCGQWHFGLHMCPPVSPFACNHCRCIDVPPSGERTKLHRKCCKCYDVMAASEP